MSLYHRPIGFREVVPDQTIPDKCVEFIINTGGARNTLQDIKLPECSGGFPLPSRNSIIYWTTLHDVLQLVEVSLEVSLFGNRIKYKFQDTPILDGISIHQSFNSIVVLVPTVSSVHKMTFMIPDKSKKTEVGLSSIFIDASTYTASENSYVLPQNGTSPLPNTGASCLTSNDECIFALSNSLGHIFTVKLDKLPGMVTVNSCKSSSVLGRLWGSLGGIIKTQNDSFSAFNLTIAYLFDDYFIFALCHDHKIRMWSASNFECLLVSDLLSYAAEDSKNLSQGTQNHILRKIVDGSHVSLVCFLSFSSHSQFCILKPELVSGTFEMKHIGTIYAPEFDLIDFTATPGHLWTLWNNSEGDSVFRSFDFGDKGEWLTVFLEDSVPLDFNSENSTDSDPVQIYLSRLFYPGRFSLSTLVKAMSIYRRNEQTTQRDFSCSQVKEDVILCMEEEIRNQVTEFEISDEEYSALANETWSKFYSVVLQYHQADLYPLGLLIDPYSGLISIIKKNGISFVRPLDILEYCVLKPRESEDLLTSQDLFTETAFLSQDPSLSQDVFHLLQAISFVSSHVSEEMTSIFTHRLTRCDSSPEVIALDVATEILSVSNVDFTQRLSSRLQQVSELGKALEVLLLMLELDRGIVSQSKGKGEKETEETKAEEDGETNNFFTFSPTENNDDESRSGFVFSSRLGISVLSESLHQMSVLRYHLIKDVLILQVLILNIGSSLSVSYSVSENIHSTTMPLSVALLHSYFVLLWFTETSVTIPSSNCLEKGNRQMMMMKINSSSSRRGDEDVSSLYSSILNSSSSSSRPLTLSELFLSGPGRKARNYLNVYNSDSWSSFLLPLLNISAQFLWPKCPIPLVTHFLLSSCQYSQIQEYVRLCKTWCDWNSHSRLFLLGVSLLSSGEPEKAFDSMIQAGGGISYDIFLQSILFGERGAEEMNKSKLTLFYFLKVIQLFESYGFIDFVIQLAETALVVSDPAESDKATLYYILFSYHLKLSHYNEAYESLVSNPEPSRRKDALRSFIVNLFERRQIVLLSSFPYIDMFEDFERIIESRARSVDLTINNYYDFLYSFHVLKENYRRAAHIMYECGIRLQTEVNTKEGLKRQAQCFLATINALKLVNKDYRWIVKPVYMTEFTTTSPKHDFEGMELDSESRSRKGAKKMIVIELHEIQRDFECIVAQLKLLNQNSNDVSFTRNSPSETVGLLIASNYYEDALRLSDLFSLDKRAILEGLTTKCVRLTSPGSDKDSAWDWLGENNPIGIDIRSGSSVSAAWKLLENILERFEVKGQTSLRKAVVSRLFSLGYPLPNWILSVYKRVNPSELLRLYLKNGYLESASLLTLEYISALLGKGKEYFGLSTCLHPAMTSPLWLPYTSLDQLLFELEFHSSSNTHYEHLYTEVKNKINEYLETAFRVSKDMFELRRNSIPTY